MDKIKIKKIKNNLVAFFKYHPDRVAFIKCCPDGRKFDKLNKWWVISPTLSNLQYLKNGGVVSPILDFLLNELNGTIEKSPEIKIDWGDIIPFGHQKSGCPLLLSYYYRALFWEQGTGKTLTMIKALEYLFQNNLIKRVLIVCPKTVISVWNRGIKTFTDFDPVSLSGLTKEKRLKALGRDKEIFLMNYDILSTLETELIDKNFSAIVFDESHFLKNSRSNRADAAYKITGNIEYRYMLTGTPISKADPTDFFGQFKILDESIFGKSFYNFRGRFLINEGGERGKWTLDKDKIDELKRLVALRAERIKKADVLDLPPKLFQTLKIEMTPEQKKHYLSLKRMFRTEFENDKKLNTVVKISNFLSKMMKLAQVCNGFIKDGENIYNLKHNKIKVLSDFVGNYEGKIIIFTIFKKDIENIKLELDSKYKIEVIDGTKSDKEREQSITNFQEGDSDIIVLQIKAGSTGITLTAASMCIYYSLDYNLIDYLQSQDRPHRIGQKKAVTYLKLITENSIEEKINEVLEDKKYMAGLIQGDVEPVSNKLYKKFMDEI